MYPPIMLVDCSGCRRPLQPPPGASSITCYLCSVVTHVIADPHYSVVAPQLPSSAPHYYWNTPSPWSGAPPGPPPNVHGRKKAVIVGITYRNSRHELEGSINDAKCMRELLISRFQFPDASILMLTEGTDPYRIPTRQNMRMAMSWLVQGCQAGDSLVFYYSGHGSQLQTYNSDEADGYDEALCPLDYETQGMIVDDDINGLLVRPLPHGVRLHALIDASHSGTVLDLPFLWRMKRERSEYGWEDHRPRSGAWKGSNGGVVISFSSCHDHQTSAQTSARSSEIPTNGAMTFCFILAIESGYGGNYGSILNSMRTNIRKVVPNGRSTAAVAGVGLAAAASVTCSLLTGDVVVTPLISMLLLGRRFLGRRRKIQEPQLAASQQFEEFCLERKRKKQSD